MKFTPCKGREWCTDTGTHCGGCGRSHEEIAETKVLLNSLVEFAQKQDYDNPEDFAQYISEALLKKLQQVAK